MSYNTRLQNNNTSLEGNNTDLQSILNTINNLPAATESIDLDAEIAAQDTIISQIQEALANKTSNNGGASFDTCTVEFTNRNYFYQLTTIDNGVVTLISDSIGYNGATVYNVLCNSIAIIEPMFVEIDRITVDGSENGVWYNSEYGTITIPNKSGQTVVVNVETI